MSEPDMPEPAATDFSQLTTEHQSLLLTLARRTLTYGAEHHTRLHTDFSQYPDLLQQMGCCFVTLTLAGKLRGCIGSLEPYQPLVQDVATHAFAAGFQDRRFQPISVDELAQAVIDISILTPQQPIECDSEAELLDQLKPHHDGLTLRDGPHHATFLPSVWKQLPDKNDFLAALKQKAGLASDYWSDSLQAFRYHSISFTEKDAGRNLT